jgi:precorrin-3B methylase
MQITLEVGKESLEVFDLVAALVADIKAKKSMAEVAAENLPLLYSALEGADKIGAELKSDVKEVTLALGVAKIAKAILA